MDRESLWHLIETADNFIKYGGGSARALQRAQRRYEEVAQVARTVGDDAILKQVELRLEDLQRRSLDGSSVIDDSDEPASSYTAELPEHAADRVPPRQRVKRGWPVLHEGPIPRFDPATWRLRVWGECERALELTYEDVKALPNVFVTADFHCVTGWSKLDNVWRGVATRKLLEMAGATENALHALVHAPYGYNANVPVAALLDETSLVAWGHNGSDLAPKHGYPLRLVVPPLYAWKSVKWVTGFELLEHDRRGFWEVRGYHNRADPWREERYSYQEA